MSIKMTAVDVCPATLFPSVYNRIADGATLSGNSDSCWLHLRDGDSWRLRDPKDAIRITHITGWWWKSAGYRRLLDKYQFPGFVELEASDRLLDVGAYIGEFSRCAAEVGASVVAAVEPDPRSAAALERNIEAPIIQRPLWHSESTVGFTVADDGSESGLLDPDSGSGRTIEATATTLESVCREYDPTFVKLEAEGVEPEIIDGLDELRPPKIAIDCSPERDGDGTIGPCLNRLGELGYETRLDREIVFGRCDDCCEGQR